MRSRNALCGFLLYFSYFSYFNAFEEKVCEGIPDIYKEQYFVLKKRLQNCTYIKGSLSLYKLQPGDDLSFLKSIRIIEGYLHIHLNGAPIIPLINLEIIMGRELGPRNDGRYALIISDNAYEGRENEISYERYEVEKDPYLTNESAEAKRIQRLGGAVPTYTRGPLQSTQIIPASTLHSIQFYSLGEILRGGVYINNNQGLCHLMATINWTDIVTGPPRGSPIHVLNANNHEPSHDESRSQLCPPLSQACSFHCRSGHCWDYHHCQLVFGRDCHPSCQRTFTAPDALSAFPNYNAQGLGPVEALQRQQPIAPRCRGRSARECCHPECAGSCTGHTDRDCTVCRNFYDTYNRKCVAQCPFDVAARPGPSRLFTFGLECVLHCPIHYLAMDRLGFCLKTCPEGYAEGSNPSDPPGSPLTCLKVDCNARATDPLGTTPAGLAHAAHCPRACPTVTDLYSNNIARLAGCQIINGELSILDQAFAPRRSWNNATHDLVLRPFVLAELDQLRSVRKIGGNLRIQHFPASVRSLEFFDNLVEISGREKLMYAMFCMFVVNTRLEYLGLRSLAWLPGGGFGSQNNTELCYNDPGFDWPLLGRQPAPTTTTDPPPRNNIWMTLTRSTPPRDSAPTTQFRPYLTHDDSTIYIMFSNDRSESDCAASGLTCHPQCSTRSYPSAVSPELTRRCWGPGAHMCFGCQARVLTLALHNHTLVHDVINAVGLIVDMVKQAQESPKRDLLYRLLLNATYQLTGLDTWDIDLLPDRLTTGGGARLLNFYGDSVRVCVPDCRNLISGSGLSPASAWAQVYGSLLTVIEQIKPNAAPSITGEEELTFADIKLRVKEVFYDMLGPDLGLPESSGSQDVKETLKIYAYESHVDRSEFERLLSQAMQDGALPKEHVCRLCHPECSEGCSGPTAGDCYACKRFKLPSSSPDAPISAGHALGDSTESFKCFRKCPNGLYGDTRSGTCTPCHHDCFSCTGPGNHIGQGGCQHCKLLHRSPNDKQVCLPDKCPDGFYPATYSNEDQHEFPNSNQGSRAMVCRGCDQVCHTCQGPGASACTRCKYIDFAGTCVRHCPFKTYGVVGLGTPTLAEIGDAPTNDPTKVATILLNHRRCPCHAECADHACHGPTDWQCDRCKNMAVESFDGLAPNASPRLTCVRDCPPDMPHVKVLDNGIRVCRQGHIKPETLLMLKSSAPPLLLIVLGCLLAVFIGKRNKERRIKKKALEFRQLLNSMNKHAPTDDSISFCLSPLTPRGDDSVLPEQLINLASDGHEDTRVRKIPERELTMGRRLTARDFFANHSLGFWNYPDLSRNLPVTVKVLKTGLLLTESESVAFEESLANIVGICSQGTRKKQSPTALANGRANADPLPLTNRPTSPAYETARTAPLVPLYGLTVNTGSPCTPSYSSSGSSTFLGAFVKNFTPRNSHKSATPQGTSGPLLGDYLLSKPLTLVSQFSPSGTNLEILFLKLRSDAIDNGRSGSDIAPGSLQQRPEAWSIMKSHVPRWCVQIADAMRFLARHNLVHANLTARCIQLYSMDQVKVDDYYYHELLSREGGTAAMPLLVDEFMQHNYKWVAQETFAIQKFTHESDVWSFGVTLWQILTFGLEPYESMDYDTYLEEIRGGYRLPQPFFTDVMLYQTLIKCWLEHPETRPSFEELYQTLASLARHPDKHFLAQRMRQQSWHALKFPNPRCPSLSSSTLPPRPGPPTAAGPAISCNRTYPKTGPDQGSGLPSTSATRQSTSWPATEYYTEIIGGGASLYGPTTPPPLTSCSPTSDSHVYQYPEYADIIRQSRGSEGSVSFANRPSPGASPLDDDDETTTCTYLSPRHLVPSTGGSSVNVRKYVGTLSDLSRTGPLHTSTYSAARSRTPLIFFNDGDFRPAPNFVYGTAERSTEKSESLTNPRSRPPAPSPARLDESLNYETFHNEGAMVAPRDSTIYSNAYGRTLLNSNPSPATKRSLKLYIPENLSETFI